MHSWADAGISLTLDKEMMMMMVVMMMVVMVIVMMMEVVEEVKLACRNLRL